MNGLGRTLRVIGVRTKPRVTGDSMRLQIEP